jgi:hypothetical protein
MLMEYQNQRIDIGFFLLPPSVEKRPRSLAPHKEGAS